MIIIDFNQVVFATFFAAVRQHTNVAIEVPMVRHMTLNMLRAIRQRFKLHDVVIASDSVNNWRKDYFPHYKARRKQSREQTDVDWGALFNSLDTIRHELHENFPYTFIQVDGCEADDVIGTIVFNRHAREFFMETVDNSETIIISADKDFKQLQRYNGVSQYDPINKRWIKEDNAEETLFDHILRGDKDDDIPNVLSDDDTFIVEGKRQNSMTKKRIEMLQAVQSDENHKYYRNYIRNKTLIDLTMTPEKYKKEIVKFFLIGPRTNDKSKLYSYMVKHRLSALLEHLDQF